MVRVAIIEDDAEVRETLAEYLNQQPDFACVLDTPSMEEALAGLKAIAAPEVIMTDLGLPGMSGLEGIVHLRQRCPEADIIVLTVYHDAHRIFQALCAGATGYLLKSTPLPEVLTGIASVRAGGSVMSPEVARQVIGHFQRPAPPAHAGQPPTEPLSPREKEIVDCLAEGLSHKLIADRLCLAIDTVRFHFRNIYRKLHVNSQTELLAKVIRHQV